MKVKVAQSRLALCDLLDYIIHEILQARILEWVAFPFSRGFSKPRDQTQVSCIAGGFFTSWASREAQCSVNSHIFREILQNSPSQASAICEPWTPWYQAGFRKGRGNRDQIANIHWITEKARESRKTSISSLLTIPKPLTVWITINCGKFWKRWEYQTTGPASWEICMQVRKQQLELDMEQQTGSK